MAYIPGPGAKDKKTVAPVESDPAIIEEKPLKRYYEERARLRKKERPVKIGRAHV